MCVIICLHICQCIFTLDAFVLLFHFDSVTVLTRHALHQIRSSSRDRFEKIFIDSGDPKLLRQAERFMMDHERDERSSGSRGVKVRDEDEDMAVEEPEDVEMQRDEGDDGMVMALHPDEAVRKAIRRIRDRVEDSKRSNLS